MPPSTPDCALMTLSLVPFPPAWGFRILCPMDKRKESLGCWLKEAGPGLRWPTVLADVLFLLQRPPCWLLEPIIHGTSSPPIQNHPDAVASSCCPKASLNRRVSFVTSLSSRWGHGPLSPA